MKRIFLFFLMLFSFPCAAQNLLDAKKVEHIGVFDDWNAYIFNSKKDKVCYVASQPLKSSGEYQRRGDVFLIISHRPDEQLFDVLTYVAGYTYLPRSEVLFRVGNVKANLFTSEDRPRHRQRPDHRRHRNARRFFDERVQQRDGSDQPPVPPARGIMRTKCFFIFFNSAMLAFNKPFEV